MISGVLTSSKEKKKAKKLFFLPLKSSRTFEFMNWRQTTETMTNRSFPRMLTVDNEKSSTMGIKAHPISDATETDSSQISFWQQTNKKMLDAYTHQHNCAWPNFFPSPHLPTFQRVSRILFSSCTLYAYFLAFCGFLLVGWHARWFVFFLPFHLTHFFGFFLFRLLNGQVQWMRCGTKAFVRI